MIILVLGVIGVSLGAWFAYKSKQWKKNFASDKSDKYGSAALYAGLPGTAILFAVTIGFLFTQVLAENRYENMIHQKEVIEYQLETGETDEDIYSEIIDFNNEIRKHKRLINNPFVGIFCNKKIAENIDYIDYLIVSPSKNPIRLDPENAITCQPDNTSSSISDWINEMLNAMSRLITALFAPMSNTEVGNNSQYNGNGI